MKKKVVILSSSLLMLLGGGGYLSLKDTNTETEVLKEKLTDENLVGVYIESEDGYSKSNTIPESGYVFNENESYCKIGDTEDENITLTYDSATKTLSVSPITKEGTKCYLYFDKQPTAKDTILSHYPTVLTRNDFNTIVEGTTTGTIYKSLDESQYDNDGEVYYFAGNPTDNWFSFAGYNWRIIRINGDGTIRMIYQGTGANTTGAGTQIGISAFNTNYNNNAYVGYMYTLNDVHGLSINSTIKGVLDQWYQNNLTSVSDKIDGNAGFCGDRTPSLYPYGGNISGGTGTTMTYYGACVRLTTNKAPTFKCQYETDLYTTSGSSKGNKSLQYPIGLISADEVSFAGSKNAMMASGIDVYLNTGNKYWTMSPFIVDTYGVAYEFHVDNYGYLMNYITSDESIAIRPVINLKGDITITGSGTTSDPYRVKGA